MRIHRFVIAGIALVLGGCSSSVEMDEQPAYVLLDRNARQNSVLIHGSWAGNPALPLEFDAMDSLSWKMNADELDAMPIELQGGKLAYLHGNPVSIEWLELGADARNDRLILHGSEQSLRELASLVGGSFSERGDGFWTLAAAGLFSKTSFLEAGDGILEAIPDTWVETGDSDIRIGSNENSIVFNTNSFAFGDEGEEGGEPVLPGRAEALAVGIYSAGDSLMVLDASGHFSISDICSGEAKDEGYFYAGGRGVVLRSKRNGNQALVPTGTGFQNEKGISFKPVEPSNFISLSIGGE